jgi:hypothetical protein
LKNAIAFFSKPPPLSSGVQPSVFMRERMISPGLALIAAGPKMAKRSPSRRMIGVS